MKFLNKSSKPGSKKTGTVLRQPDEATPITKEKARAEHTALEMAERQDWEVKTLPVWKAGDVILDTYEVENVISGGMGHVYMANHNKWNVKLAIKSPNEMMLSDKSNFARILREANSWTELGLHPNIAYCYYVRNLEDVPHIFVEYVDGGNLRQWIEEGKCIDYRTSLDLAIQFCHGMEYAHSKGLIHRDIKPENVLMTQDGILKITDFGLVRGGSAGSGSPDFESGRTQQPQGAGLTTVGTLMGTEGYMAPEQAESARDVDERADIFSFGVCLYEMLCGNRPYEITYGPKQEAPDPIALSGDKAFPVELGKVLEKCIQWKPTDRYKSFDEIWLELSVIYEDLFKKESPYVHLEILDLEADGLNNQGVSYYDLERKEEALSRWKKALENNQTHPEATYNLSLILWRDGRIADDEVLRRLDNCGNNPGVDGERLAELKAFIHAERLDFDAARVVLKEFPGRYDSLFSGKDVHQMRSIRTLKGHTDAVASVALTPDGRYAVSGSRDGTLRIWEIETGQSIRTLEGHTGRVSSVTISPDGRYAVSCCDKQDSNIRVWELETGKSVRTIEEQTNMVFSVAFSPDGKYLVSGNFVKNVHVWEFASGRCVRTLKGHKKWIKSIAVSPDGRYAVSCGGRTLRVWELSSGQCVQTLKGHTGRVSSVTISPDGRYAVSSGGRTLRVWELTSGRCVRTLEGHTDSVSSVAFSPDGLHLISGSSDNTVRVWEFASGRCVRTLEGHTRGIQSVALSPDSRHAVSASGDSSVRVWKIIPDITYKADLKLSLLKGFKERKKEEDALDLAIEQAKTLYKEKDYRNSFSSLFEAWKVAGFSDNESIKRLYSNLMKKGRVNALSSSFQIALLSGHTGGVISVALSPDGRYAVSGSTDKTLRVWEISNGRCVRTLEGHTAAVSSVALSADGRCAVSGGKDTRLLVWELSSGQCVHTLETGKWTGNVESVVVSLDGRYAVSATWDDILRVWELSSGQCVHTLKGHTDFAVSVAISPDGRYVVSASRDTTLRVWELSSGHCVHTLKGHTGRLSSVTISPDGLHAVSGSLDKTLRVWELASGRCVHTIEGASILTISPDGRFAVSQRRDDNTLRMWELLSGRCIRTLEGHTRWVGSVVFTPDGRHAVSGSSDHTLRVWELSSGRCVHTLEGHTDNVKSVVLSPDGRYAVSGSADNTLRVWELIWDLEFPDPVDWDEGVRPYLEIFLTLRNGKWTEEDFQELIAELAEKRGYGWVRTEGIRKELERMTKEYKN